MHMQEVEAKAEKMCYKKQVSKEVPTPANTVRIVNKFASHENM